MFSKIRINILVYHLVVISILLFVLRTSIPIFKYLFIIIFIPTLIYILINYLPSYKKLRFRDFRSFLWLMVSFVVLIFSFILSQKSYIIVFKDIVNTFIVFTLFFLLIPICIENGSVDKIYNTFLKYIVIFSVIICTKDIVVFYYSIEIPHGRITDLEKLIGISSTFQTDYNFSILPLLFSIVIILSYSTIKKKFLSNFFSVSNLILIVFTIDLLLSGSRRGLILYTGLITVLIIINLLPKSILEILISHKNRLRINFKVYFVSLLVIFLIATSFISLSSFQQKNKLLTIAGINTSLTTKKNISTIFYRYFKICNKKTSFEEFNDKLWSIRVNSEKTEVPKNFDPRYPDSGWGKKKHITVKTNFGENRSILPKGAKGYLLDSTTNINYWKDQAYSKTKINNILVKPGDIIHFSSYCYVSEDFNGTYVAVYIDGEKTSRIQKKYNYEKKGSWQFLFIKYPIEKHDTIGCYLFWTKHYDPNSDSLNILGHVVFAYPTLEVISKSDSIFSDTIHSYSTIPKFNVFHKKYSNTDEIIGFQKASIINELPKIPFTIILQKTQDSDPIRNWIRNMFNEDTTYYGYSADISHFQYSNEAIQGRTNLWQFAWELYTKEYNWVQKIFGNGFNYLNWYGYYFYSDKQRTNWPHNPFLSVLLYSGIIGLVLYFFLLFKVIAIYLNYIKEYYLLFLFWGITFFFSFFSANSPFSPPIMGFFMTLPFFVDYIHKKDKSDKFAVQSKQK